MVCPLQHVLFQYTPIVFARLVCSSRPPFPPFLYTPVARIGYSQDRVCVPGLRTELCTISVSRGNHPKESPFSFASVAVYKINPRRFTTQVHNAGSQRIVTVANCKTPPKRTRNAGSQRATQKRDCDNPGWPQHGSGCGNAASPTQPTTQESREALLCNCIWQRRAATLRRQRGVATTRVASGLQERGVATA